MVAFTLTTSQGQEPGAVPLGDEQAKTALRISEIRLELPASIESGPNSILRFNLANDGIGRLADVILKIAIFEKAIEAAPTPRAIVRPFRLHTATILEAGYSVEYEMLFRNLAADCDCVPKVEVMSARIAR